MSDAAAAESDVARWQGFANGDVQPLASGLAWGEEDIIAAPAALTAINAANLQVYSASGDVSPVEHGNGILASRNLQFVPDPEF